MKIIMELFKLTEHPDRVNDHEKGVDFLRGRFDCEAQFKVVLEGKETEESAKAYMLEKMLAVEVIVNQATVVEDSSLAAAINEAAKRMEMQARPRGRVL